MTTRLQFTGTYAADGTPETVDPSVPTIETKHDFETKGVQGGAQINPHAGFMRLQQGQEGADEAALQDAQARADLFGEELDRLRSITSAGRSVDQKTLENLQHEFNDTAIGWVRAGGDVNDPQLVALRETVDDISRDARRNN